MRSVWVRFVMLATLLVISGAVEEVLPRIGGMGIPLLLAGTICLAIIGGAFEMVIFAMAAGAFEESLSSLPVMSMVSTFVIVAVLVRWIRRKVVG